MEIYPFNFDISFQHGCKFVAEEVNKPLTKNTCMPICILEMKYKLYGAKYYLRYLIDQLVIATKLAEFT